jgi:hypothetical protein
MKGERRLGVELESVTAAGRSLRCVTIFAPGECGVWPTKDVEGGFVDH